MLDNFNAKKNDEEFDFAVYFSNAQNFIDRNSTFLDEFWSQSNRKYFLTIGSCWTIQGKFLI